MKKLIALITLCVLLFAAAVQPSAAGGSLSAGCEPGEAHQTELPGAGDKKQRAQAIIES